MGKTWLFRDVRCAISWTLVMTCSYGRGGAERFGSFRGRPASSHASCAATISAWAASIRFRHVSAMRRGAW